MKICGLQKLTLLDYPGHLAAVVFLGGCNFRCPFCQNRSLVIPEPVKTKDTASGAKEVPVWPVPADDTHIPADTLFSFLEKRTGILDGVCISGGEPTLHQELPELIRRIRRLGYLIKLDTNGSSPQMLSALLKEGLLDYVAMDLKAGRRNYASAAGLDCEPAGTLDRIEQSVSLLMNADVDYEFRTTVVKGLHTEEDFEDIASWIVGCRRYALQSFRDGDTILMQDHPFSAFSSEELGYFLKIVQKKIPCAFIRGD